MKARLKLRADGDRAVVVRLNPYKQTELWHRTMMLSHYNCVHAGCNGRHAVVVQDMKPTCVFHLDDFVGVVKESRWL